MSVARYRWLARYAGDWIDTLVPRSFSIDDVAEIRASCGVYIVCEPLENVQYVGSVCRPRAESGVVDRIAEHLREGHKRMLWKTVWVLPLRPETPREAVRAVEACVGADLGPLGGDRLPRL